MQDLNFLIYVGLSVLIGWLVGQRYGSDAGKLWMLFWPFRLVHVWLERQAQAWHAPPVRVDQWLKAEKTRRVWRVGRLTVLYRPLMALDIPLLLTPSELVLTPVFGRLRVCWKTR